MALLSEKVTKEMTAPWEKTTLPTLLARYHLKNIFNVDKFGLFYEALRSKSLHFRGKRCSGGKRLELELENLPIQDALSTSVTSLVDIDLKRKYGWMEHFLRSGCASSIVSSKCKEEKLL